MKTGWRCQPHLSFVSAFEYISPINAGKPALSFCLGKGRKKTTPPPEKKAPGWVQTVFCRKCPQLCGNKLKHPANDTANVHSQFLDFFLEEESGFFFFFCSVLCKCKSMRSPVKAPFPCSSGSRQLSGSERGCSSVDAASNTPPTLGLKRRAPSKSAFFVHLFFFALVSKPAHAPPLASL